MEIPWESNSGTSEPSRSQKGHGRRVGAPVKAKYEDIYQEIDDVLQEHYENEGSNGFRSIANILRILNDRLGKNRLATIPNSTLRNHIKSWFKKPR